MAPGLCQTKANGCLGASGRVLFEIPDTMNYMLERILERDLSIDGCRSRDNFRIRDCPGSGEIQDIAGFHSRRLPNLADDRLEFLCQVVPFLRIPSHPVDPQHAIIMQAFPGICDEFPRCALLRKLITKICVDENASVLTR